MELCTKYGFKNAGSLSAILKKARSGKPLNFRRGRPPRKDGPQDADPLDGKLPELKPGATRQAILEIWKRHKSRCGFDRLAHALKGEAGIALIASPPAADEGDGHRMSRKGNCLDNAVIENFFGRFKAELFHGQEGKFKTAGDLIAAMPGMIRWHSQERISRRTGWKTHAAHLAEYENARRVAGAIGCSLNSRD